MLRGVFRPVKPDERGVRPFLARVNVLFLGLTCRLCLFDVRTGFFFLLDVLEFKDNWLAALFGSAGEAEASEVSARVYRCVVVPLTKVRCIRHCMRTM